MLSRYGERIASTNPAITPPPIGSSSRSACGRSLMTPERLERRRTQKVETSSRAAAPNSRNAGCTSKASEAVRLDPTMAPSVAPAAMKPNSRLPCSEVKISTTIDQKIETTNRLNTEIQMKKKRPTQMVCSGVAKCSAAPNSKMVTGEEAVGQRNELPARQQLHQRRERHVQHQHDDQRAGEQPGQIVHAAGDAHLVADRPQDVVGREHREDVEPAPAERGKLGRPDVDQPVQDS